MLVTSWVSSRLGLRRTLLAGLLLIVAFSALSGRASSIGGIVGYRAGWGPGNALFIAARSDRDRRRCVRRRGRSDRAL